MIGRQVAAADRIVRNVKRYGLLGNIEDAHYVKYTLDAARLAGLSAEVQRASRNSACGRPNVATVAAGALVLEGRSSVTTGDGGSPADAQPDGGRRETSANGLNARQKHGGKGSDAKHGCGDGLGNSNSDHREASVPKV